MRTANDFAKFAQECTRMAEEIKPAGPEAPYAEVRNLMIYHLRSVAGDARKIAERLAEQERVVVNANQEYNTTGQ